MRRPFDPVSLIFWSLFLGVVLTVGMWVSTSYWGTAEIVAVLLVPLWFLVGIVAMVGAVAAGVRNGMTHALMDQTERRRAARID